MGQLIKKKAPVQLTAGGGFRYENSVAARFLVDLLAGTNSLGVDLGRVSRVDWQARDLGWLADDLVVACTSSGGNRTGGISIKSAQQVTRAGFPQDFVSIAWGQWLGCKTAHKIRDNNDVIVLLTGSLAHEVEDAWSNMVSDALKTTPERMAARLAEPASDEGSQSSGLQRMLFKSFGCPEELRSAGDSTDSATVQLLCRVRLLHLDYEATPSRDNGRALIDCQSVLRSGDAEEAPALWSRLNTIADDKRAGGSIDLAGLLAELRGEFDLRDHPDYQRDRERLERSSQDAMVDIRTAIAGLSPLARESERATVKACLDRDRACLLVGESGSGKSALAKEIMADYYRRGVWFADTTLDCDTEAEFERQIGLTHPLVEVLAAVPGTCLLVFDSIERYSPRALRLACRFMQAIFAEHGPQQVHVLVTAQFERADRIIRSFVECGLPSALHKATPLNRPSQSDVQSLVAPVEELRWASLRPELRPFLTNLKILDWVVAAARSGTAINDASFLGVTNLIDVLWERWIEGDNNGLGRSHLLMRLGILEGGTLSASVPRMHLEQSEQAALGSLTSSDLVRLRDERVRFSHDLLGDWARMRVLVGEHDLSSPAIRDRANLPRWHRAVRLFGQRILEQSSDGPQRWQQAVQALEDESQAGGVICDLFLESLFLATNAAELLERSWAALSANGGRRLNRMLNRFLFVATLPDPRIAALVQGEMDGLQWEHLSRLPFWPYWGPMLTVLHAHRGEVVQLVPHTAAKVSALWLKSMPVELGEGQLMPWRREAAELALAIGREVQALNAEGNYFSDGHDKSVYEGILWASPELPNEVAGLCLELAQRRDLHPEIRERVEQTHERRREERRQYLAEHPEQAKPFPPSISGFHGPLREQWPDGPRDRVDSNFQEACLDSGAFPTLVRVRPDAALEILLAVCIEDPQYEDYSSRSMRETGVEHWRSGDPPLYCRGPFLPFLQKAPEQGLSFILRLVNFATRYYSQKQGLTVGTGSESRIWLGDSNVFRWHYGWPISDGYTINCVLMALERWLYEQIDRGESIAPWINHILRQSESLAFAGLLFDVGKYRPDLFASALKPLLSNWILIDWDRQVSTMRQHGSDPMGLWAYQPAVLIALGRQWYAMPHRRAFLIYLGGGIVQTLIGDEQQWPYLAQLRSEWLSQLNGEEPSESLRLLIERFNPENYSFELREGKRVPVGFEWPEAMNKQNQSDLRRLSDEQAITGFPYRCRRLLDSEELFTQQQLPDFWEFIQGIEARSPQLAHDGEPLHHVEDLLCGAIAALILKHCDWLVSDPVRMAWCRSKMEAVVQNPPAPLRFDSETASGDQRWDSFAAEAGVALLARDRNDPLARRLVATGVLSFHYSTMARTFVRASRCREQLGQDFDRMLALAIRWAGLHTSYSLAARIRPEADPEEKYVGKDALIQEFVDQRSPLELPDIRQIDATAAADIEAIRARQFPEQTRNRRARRKTQRPARRSETLYRHRLSVDPRVISSAFAWLDLQSARPDERGKWLGLIRNFLDIALSSIPQISDARQQEIDGLPDEFDSWVFGLVAKAIPNLTAAQDHRSLWRPILDRGSPAHKWVERFFWDWFTDGLHAAQSPQQFTQLWAAMIQYALESPAWDPAINRSYDLDSAVFEMLGFNSRMNKLGQKPEFAAALVNMESIFAKAAERWFRMPKVAAGFLYFVTQPAAAGLLVPAIRWLAVTVPSFGSYDWKYGLEDNLIVFLHTSWERQNQTISNDPALQSAFLSLLACVVSRGGHAAIALRDHVVNG
jgi:hypothetical protein